jgi:NAD(P)-dependent dehydrogenase (short-subunit alcohol dehydrogenase family)
MHETGRFASYPSLRDRSVLVTGGGSGIGAEIVESFVGQGARVAFLDVARDSSEALVDRLAESGRAPLFVECDLTDVTALRAAISRVEERLGPFRVLVNNAADDDRHRFEDVTPEYWDQRMAVNLRHQFFTIQGVAPGMRRAGGGSIVNMGSIAWAIPSTGHVAYVTAKAAVMGLTRTLARELGPDAIRVNCVMPGAILTERQLRLWLTAEYKAKILQSQSLKRHLFPDDVARLVLFLAADDSAAITSQSYVVDGGWI